MGQSLNDERNAPIGIKFTRNGNSFKASVALSDLAAIDGEPSRVLADASEVYSEFVSQIEEWHRASLERQKSREKTTARQAWDLGDLIIQLRRTLAAQGFEVVDVYRHLSDHSGISYWSQRFTTFRTYIPERGLIPPDLTWRQIRSRTRSAAKSIVSKREQ